MNYLEELRWLLEDQWTPDPVGVQRTESVPVPEIVIEDDEQDHELSTQDYVVVEERTGGDRDWALNQSLHKTFRASLLVKSDNRRFDGEYIDGQERVYGVFDETNRSHGEYGGLTGEVERILDNEIDGGPNFDIIIPDSNWERLDKYYGGWAARLDVDLRSSEER